MESESDWDETTAEAITPRVAKGDNAPKIEFDSEDDDYVAGGKQKKLNNVKGKPDLMINGSRNRFNEEPVGGSRGSSNRSSPSTVKSAPRSALSAVTFTDTRNNYSDEERPTPRPRVSSPSRTHSPGQPPPYDFSTAITEERNTPQPDISGPPGKERKGTNYDPGLGSWDDSEAEEQTLAQLRENIQKGNQVKNSSTKKENKSSSNWRDKFKSKSKTGSSKKNNSASIQEEYVSSAVQSPRSETAQSPRSPSADVPISEIQQYTNKSLQHQHLESPWPESPKHIQNKHLLNPNQRNDYIYYFAEEKTEYLYAIEDHKNVKMEQIGQKVVPYVTRGVRECLGVFHLILSVIMIFIVELIKFVLRSILYPLIYGILNSISDYVTKPLLAVWFNGCLQPCLMVCYNVMVAMRTVCLPIIDVFKQCAQVCVIMLNAWRLCPISITNNNRTGRYTETASIQDV